MTTTTYLGSLAGANDANTEVAWPPKISAVPVFAATCTCFNRKPATAPAGVPGVPPPPSGLRLHRRAHRGTGRCRVTGGLIRWTTWPVGDSSAAPIRGLYRVPPLASAA